MANSKYEYVKNFEKSDALLPNTWIVVRIDGHSFHRFSQLHDFAKPNDRGALELMNEAAKSVMRQFPDCVLGYGVSDEYSFVIRPSYTSYDRRESKLVTTIVSIFTGAYIMNWNTYFPGTPLRYAPSFDGRAVLYPTTLNLRDYLAWRQVDCHINNLFNTTFWALQLMTPKTSDSTHKMSAVEAEQRLKGTLSAEKNEILWREYGVNYNDELEMYKKGSILIYDIDSGDDGVGDDSNSNSNSNSSSASEQNGQRKLEKKRKKAGVSLVHVDLIGDAFWTKYPNILDSSMR